MPRPSYFSLPPRGGGPGWGVRGVRLERFSLALPTRARAVRGGMPTRGGSLPRLPRQRVGMSRDGSHAHVAAVPPSDTPPGAWACHPTPRPLADDYRAFVFGGSSLAAEMSLSNWRS